MDEFTKAEIERINQLYGTDFKDITPEDARLIGRFEAHRATKEGEYQARIKAIEDEGKLARKQIEEEHTRAMANLEMLARAARERLKAAKDEQ